MIPSHFLFTVTALAMYRGDTKIAYREYQAIVLDDPLSVESQSFAQP
jgi:hypothetical protein